MGYLSNNLHQFEPKKEKEGPTPTKTPNSITDLLFQEVDILSDTNKKLSELINHLNKTIG